MKLKRKLFLFSFICIGLIAFRFVEETSFVVPPNFPKPDYNFTKNNLTKNKILLGRALFYDPLLSRNNKISCAGCHSQFSAFAHVDHALSHGIEDKIGFRNAPGLQNLAWQKLFMRDGAINQLDVQALAPLSDSLEMDENISLVVVELQASKLYPKLYFQAFGDSVVTGERTLKAISQFLLTLVSCNSKYDSVLQKHTTFTEQENKGYLLFKKNCVSCHTEPLFTNDEFKNNGLPMDTGLMDFGRYRVTKNPEDSMKFKVPSLRNIEFTSPYMHDGRFKKLMQVLDHYTHGIQKGKTLAMELQKPIELSSREKVDIMAFLLTLSDKKFLFNPDYFYPKELFSQKAKD